MDSSKMKSQELVSALADGQLRGEAFARAVEAVSADPAARQAWCDYHLIGDVLRGGRSVAGTPAAAFLDKLSQRLAQEAPVPAPAQSAMVIVPPAVVRPAANDESFRWKLVAGFASLAAVAAVGWTLVASQAPSAQPQLASAPQAAPAGAVVAGAERGAMIRDPRLDEFLAAHRQFGGASALQMPAGFLRNATFESPER